MLKVIVPIALFILVVFGISHYWSKANISNKKKIATSLGAILLTTLAATTYLIIN